MPERLQDLRFFLYATPPLIPLEMCWWTMLLKYAPWDRCSNYSDQELSDAWGFGELSKKGDEQAIQLGSKLHCTQEEVCCHYFTVVHVLRPRSQVSPCCDKIIKNKFRKNIDTGLTLRAQGLRSIWKVHVVSGIYSICILQPKIVQDCFVSVCFFTGLILRLRILTLISWPTYCRILQYYCARIPETCFIVLSHFEVDNSSLNHF